MSEDGIFLLKIDGLLPPLLLLRTVLATIKAADWLDRCEARQHPAE